MRVLRSIDDRTLPLPASVVTIGNFDGVHVGHQAVLRAVVAHARELNAQAVAVTFDPHPAHLLRPGEPRLQLLTPLGVKLSLLAQTGLDAALVLPFNTDLRTWTAREFAERILRRALAAVEVHEGETFRFGRDAEADITGLAQLGQELGFTVQAWQPVLLRGGPVSSSRIRKAVGAGRMTESRALLGRPFYVCGTPASGRGYGTRYAVPTINLAPYPELLPANGVYVTELRIGEGTAARTFQGVTNAGNRPTFGADSFAVESHLFDFEPVTLGEATPLELNFLHRLRGEQRFESPEALREQIGRDVAKAHRYFALAKALRLAVEPKRP